MIEIQVARDASSCKILVDGRDITQELHISKMTLVVDADSDDSVKLVLELRQDEIRVVGDVPVEGM